MDKDATRNQGHCCNQDISPLPAPPVAGLGRWGEALGSSSNRPLYRNNHVELLIDWPATYRKMLDSVRHAQELIYLETYIFADEEVGRKFCPCAEREE